LNTKRKQDLENTNTSNHSVLKTISSLALVSWKWNIVTTCITLLVCKTEGFNRSDFILLRRLYPHKVLIGPELL